MSTLLTKSTNLSNPLLLMCWSAWMRNQMASFKAQQAQVKPCHFSAPPWLGPTNTNRITNSQRLRSSMPRELTRSWSRWLARSTSSATMSRYLSSAAEISPALMRTWSYCEDRTKSWSVGWESPKEKGYPAICIRYLIIYQGRVFLSEARAWQTYGSRVNYTEGQIIGFLPFLLWKIFQANRQYCSYTL
jgi:hypothetical protein